MNANKALELGFCDEIMFKREEAEADAEDSFSIPAERSRIAC